MGFGTDKDKDATDFYFLFFFGLVVGDFRVG
jgi:hypothetical protein